MEAQEIWESPIRSAENCTVASPVCTRACNWISMDCSKFAWLWLFLCIDLDIQLVRKMTTWTRLLFIFHATQRAYNGARLTEEKKTQANACFFCYKWNNKLLCLLFLLFYFCMHFVGGVFNIWSWSIITTYFSL